jgi:WD40 repeat protein
MHVPFFRSSRFGLALLFPALLLSWAVAADEDVPGVIAVLKGNKEAVYGIAFTPDGKHLLTGSGDPAVKIWSASSGKELKAFGGPAGHRALVLSVAVSPDGATFATAGADNTAKLWDFPTDKPIRLFAQGDESHAVAVSPDGTRVAGGGKDGNIKLWTAADGKLLHDLAGHTGTVTGLAFSPNGLTLASCGDDRTLRFWNVADGKALAVFGAHSGPVNGVAFNPNGVAVYTAGADGTFKAWSMPPVGSRLVTTLDAPAASLFLSPDGTQALTSFDKTARLSTVTTGQLVRNFTGPTAPLGPVALSPNGAFVAGGTTDNEVFVWQTKDAKVVGQSFAHKGPVTGVAFNPASTQLLTGGRDGVLRLWATPPVPARSLPHPDAVRSAVLTADGKRLFTGGADKIVRSWALAAPKGPERQFSGHTGPVNAVATSADGKVLVSAGDDETIRFWDQAKGTQTAQISGHTGPVVSLALSANGQQVLSASIDGSVKLWQVPAAGKQALTHAGAVTSAALTADGARLLTGSADKQVRLWNLTTGKMERTFTGPTLGVLAVAANATYVAAGGADRSLWVWAMGTAKEHRKFVALPGAVQAVAFSLDGKYVAAGLADNTARLFDVNLGKEVQKFAGHTGPVHAILFNAKGDRVLSAGADGTVHVWGTTDGLSKSSMKHGAAVHGLALSKDGLRLASAGADKAVRIWTLADSKLAATITTPAEVRGVSWAPDARRVAVAGADGRSRVYAVDGMLHEHLAHDGPVTAVAFAADGRHVVTASADKTARLWPLSLVWAARHAAAVRQVAFSPRGPVSCGDDKVIRIWNSLDGKQVKSLSGHESAVVAVGTSGDGSKAVSAGADGKARVWDLNAKVGKEGDKPVAVIALPEKPQSVAVSPNGGRIAIGLAAAKGSKERVLIFDATGKELMQMGESAPARSLAFLSDNRTLLAAGADRTVQLLDVNVLAALPAHAGGVTGIAFHNDGARALSAGADKTVKLWNVTTGKLERTFGPLVEPISAVAFSRDGIQVGAAAGKVLRVWTTNDGKDVQTLALPVAANGLAFTTDRARLSVAGADGWARVYEVASKQELQSFPHKDAVRAVTFHPFNPALLVSASADKTVALHTITSTRVVPVGSPVQRLATVANTTHLLTAGADGKVKLWNLGTGKDERTFPVGDKALRGVAVARNNLLVATAGPDDRVRVYGLADAKLLATIKAPAVARAVAFSPDSKALAAACVDGSIRTWNVVFVPGQPLPPEFGKPLQSHAHTAQATDIAFPLNAPALFFSSSADKSVRSWKLASDAPTRSFAHPQSVNCVAFDKLGTHLATGCSDGRLRIFDVAKGTVVKDVIAHNTPNMTEVYCVAWSPDGKQVVTASRDQSLKVWDAVSGKLVRELKGHKDKVFEKGHQEAVLSAVFTPDGKQVISGGMDRTIKVWNVADGNVVRELVNPAFKTTAHPGWVYALRFTSDGKHLVSAGAAPRLRGYVAVWDVSSGKLVSGRELAIGTVFGLALAPDGKSLALGTGGSVRMPELSQGIVLKMPGAKGAK